MTGAHVKEWAHLNDVFEAESAVTGEPLAFASTTQVLSVGPLGVHVPWCYCAHAPGFLTGVTRNVLHTIWVKLLLALPTELFEVNLVCALHTPHIRALPAQITIFAVVISVFLLKKLEAHADLAGAGLRWLLGGARGGFSR